VSIEGIGVAKMRMDGGFFYMNEELEMTGLEGAL